MLKKFLLLGVIAAAVFSGYSFYQYINKKINPRQSFTHFIFFMLLNLLGIFIVVFVFSFLVIHFKEFFFSP
jgi:formate/nitrite transporter FocA (FNT family)